VKPERYAIPSAQSPALFPRTIRNTRPLLSPPIPQNAPPNDQRSTINDQRSTINDQRPTINDQRPTINDQRSTIRVRRDDTKNMVTILAKKCPNPREKRRRTSPQSKKMAKSCDSAVATNTATQENLGNTSISQLVTQPPCRK
jgi:hypothetical protein